VVSSFLPKRRMLRTGTDQREWWDDGADARAVGQAGVDNGRRIVDAAADVGNDAVDNHAHVGRVLEADVGFLKLAAAFDVDVIETIYQNVADGGVFEQGFQRTEAEDFVEYFLDEAARARPASWGWILRRRCAHNIADLLAHAVFVEQFELVG